MSGLQNHRKLSDERLHQAWALCPDDGSVLIPTGYAYSEGESPSSSSAWFIAFRCQQHPDEILRIWGPDLQPLIDEVLEGIDVSSLPIVGPGLR
jgi:hypothetical protein